VVAPEVDEAFLPVVAPLGEGVRVVYRPTLLGIATVHYANARARVDQWESLGFRVALREGLRGSPWPDAEAIDPAGPPLDDEPLEGAEWAPLLSAAVRAKSYPRWGKMLQTHVYRSCALTVYRCRQLKAVSKPGASEGDFRAELRTRLHEKRDLALEKLRKRYATRIARMQTRIRKAEARVEREEEQYEASKRSTVISMGATVLGALFGRKLGSARSVGRATTAVRGASRAVRERGDIARAEEEQVALQEQLTELEGELSAELERVRDEVDESELEIVEVPVRSRKSDTTIDRVALVWAPWRVGRDGIAEPAWE
jgi:hypothetical protein